MGKVLESLDESLQRFIERQHVFFVGTAPRSETGHINVSPKGGDTFRVLGPREVAYLDLTGSGVETIAHLNENGRIVVMFCAFEGAPKIVRLHGRGYVVPKGEPDYEALAQRFPAHAGARAVIRIEVSRVSDSCGYSVPLLEYKGDRNQLDLWTDRKGIDGIRHYRRQKNAASLDGLPGLDLREDAER